MKFVNVVSPLGLVFAFHDYHHVHTHNLVTCGEKLVRGSKQVGDVRALISHLTQVSNFVSPAFSIFFIYVSNFNMPVIFDTIDLMEKSTETTPSETCADCQTMLL